LTSGDSHPETLRLGSPADARTLILHATLDLIAKAGELDFLKFLTPSRLAYASTGVRGSPVSIGAIRYHFREGGPGLQSSLLAKELGWRLVYRVLDEERSPRSQSLRTSLASLLPRIAGTNEIERLALERLWTIWLICCDDQPIPRRMMRIADGIQIEMLLQRMRVHTRELPHLSWLQREDHPSRGRELRLANVMTALSDAHFALTQGRSTADRAAVDYAFETALLSLTRCVDTADAPWVPTRLRPRPFTTEGAPHDENLRPDSHRTRVQIIEVALAELARADIDDLLSFITPVTIAQQAGKLKDAHRLDGFPKVTPALVTHHFHLAGSVRKFDRVRLLNAATILIPPPSEVAAPETAENVWRSSSASDLPDDAAVRDRAANAYVMTLLGGFLPGLTGDPATFIRERLRHVRALVAPTHPELMLSLAEELPVKEGTSTAQSLVEAGIPLGLLNRIRGRLTYSANDIRRFTTHLQSYPLLGESDDPRVLRLPDKGDNSTFRCSTCGQTEPGKFLAVEFGSVASCNRCFASWVEVIGQRRARVKVPFEPVGDASCTVCGRPDGTCSTLFAMDEQDLFLCEHCILELAGVPGS